MLQSMRDLAQSWIVKGLMLLLIVSFAIWGIGDMFRGNPAARVVATVGSEEIQAQDLEKRFQRELTQARAAFGPSLSADQARQMGLLDRTLNMMMQELTFDQAADRLGIHLSNDYVLASLAKDPELRTKDGHFNEALFHQILGKAGLSEQAFFDMQTKGDSRKVIADAILSTGIPPQTMIDTLYQARGAKRVLEVLTLKNSSVKGVKAPTDEELQAYYDKHQNDFIAPEYRGITIGSLSAAEMAKDISITDEDLHKTYDERSAELTIPESRDLVQIVLQDEAKAKSVAEQATAMHDLSKAAKEAGLTPIAMTKIDESSMLPELRAPILALKAGDVSPAVKSPMGWHVIQVKTVTPASTPSFEQAKADLTKMLQEERTGDIIAKTINQLDDAVAGNQSLEEIADMLKIHLTRYAALDASGLDPNGASPKDPIPAKSITLPSALSLNAGETGQVLDDGNGTYYVVRVDQITPSQVRPFAEIKTKVATAWTDEQYYEKAAAEAETMAKSLREGKSATSFASHPGVTIKLSAPMSILGEPDKNLPPEIVPQVYHMKKGDVTVAARAGNQYIVRLADIVPVNPKKPESTRLKVVDDLKKKVPQNLMEQYATYLQTHFPQTLDQELLLSLKRQGN
ncbi:MAG: peptidyl-prolyl cis-trans isomerase [Bdellovibrionales bacterium]